MPTAATRCCCSSTHAASLPTYFFPRDDVRFELLTAAANPPKTSGRRYWDLQAATSVANATWSYDPPPADRSELGDFVTFEWQSMDAWYEEEEQIFAHARDPHKRVDVIASSRHVAVEIDGQMVADSRRPHLLFETHLPVRYYLPRDDVRTELLHASSTQSRCPYKGVAKYWSIEVRGQIREDVVWSYEEPIAEDPKISELMCFFNEKVDIILDGQALPRPVTPWS